MEAKFIAQLSMEQKYITAIHNMNNKISINLVYTI